MNHSELKAKTLSNPEAQAAYESLAPEFELLRQMLKARKESSLRRSERIGVNA